MQTQRSYNKLHYIQQMHYICACINKEINHGIKEIIIDNFAGGGGASTGIEIATGESVYAAINHDQEAIRMHLTNHPGTRHYCESVWDVNPLKVCNGYPVALAWFSPDCKHFSKAKGGKPKDKKIRGLAWVALRWAGLVRPRVIMLENVEEFKTWGPLNRSHRPIKNKQGITFRKFVTQLEKLGYNVEFKELVAADYGAPTMRKRFFMIARCDGMPIVWPEPTHGPKDSENVLNGKREPYVGAYTQIDFNRPCPSIFETAEEIKAKYGVRARRPLAEKTMQRIASGFQKHIINNSEPFVVQCNHGGERKTQDIKDPMPTITGKHGFGIVDPYMVQIGQTGFTQNRSKDVRDPLTTIVSKNEHCLIEPKLVPVEIDNLSGLSINRNRYPAYVDPEEMDKRPFEDTEAVKEIQETIRTEYQELVAPVLTQYHSETTRNEVRGQSLEDPIMTIDSSNRYGLVSAFIQKYICGGYDGPGTDIKNQLPTNTKEDHNSISAAHIIKMKGTNIGQNIEEPLQTITAGGLHYGKVSAELKPVTASFISQMHGQSIGTDAREPLNTMTSVNHMAEVKAFLIKYYSQGIGQDVNHPLDTITGNDRFGLVQIKGVDYVIVDIGLRMLDPDELYGCQGFPSDYVIDHDHTGKKYSRSQQVMKCGNSVSPPIPAAMVKVNLPELCKSKRLPNSGTGYKVEATGQLRFA